MRAGRIVALVIGILLLLPAIGLVFGGIGLLVARAQAGDDGFFEEDLEQLDTSTFAFTARADNTIDLTDAPQWVVDRLDIDVRVAVTGVPSTQEVFVGIADSADVDAYLQGVEHAEITDVDGSRVTTTVVQEVAGPEGAVDPPTDQTFWSASASGPGTQTVTWSADNESWTLLVMNADGAAGVRVDPQVGIKTGFLVPLGVTLLVAGLVLLVVALVLILLVAVRGSRRDRARAPSSSPAYGYPPGGAAPPAGYGPPSGSGAAPPYGQPPAYGPAPVGQPPYSPPPGPSGPPPPR